MLDLIIPSFYSWITHLSWYQSIGEILAIALFIASFLTKRLSTTSTKEKLILWRNFLRSSSFLLAFASIAIPWMISEIF